MFTGLSWVGKENKGIAWLTVLVLFGLSLTFKATASVGATANYGYSKPFYCILEDDQSGCFSLYRAPVNSNLIYLSRHSTQFYLNMIGYEMVNDPLLVSPTNRNFSSVHLMVADHCVAKRMGNHQLRVGQKVKIYLSDVSDCVDKARKLDPRVAQVLARKYLPITEDLTFIDNHFSFVTSNLVADEVNPDCQKEAIVVNQKSRLVADGEEVCLEEISPQISLDTNSANQIEQNQDQTREVLINEVREESEAQTIKTEPADGEKERKLWPSRAVTLVVKKGGGSLLSYWYLWAFGLIGGWFAWRILVVKKQLTNKEAPRQAPPIKILPSSKINKPKKRGPGRPKGSKNKTPKTKK